MMEETVTHHGETHARTPIHLSQRFQDALVYVTIVHGGQLRKGTAIPYISHLLAVASIVLEYGGTEDEAIAALLHDAVEDAGGQARLADIRARFGDAVGDIVESCSDTDQVPKPAWRARKERYINHLAEASPSARLVSAADKLANVRSILKDFRAHGSSLWRRFNGGEATLGYYRALANAFQRHGPEELAAELERQVKELEELTSRNG
jgi:GTP pyrophosphokinase